MALGDLIKKVNVQNNHNSPNRLALTSNYLFASEPVNYGETIIYKWDKSLSSFCETKWQPYCYVNGIAVTSQEDYAFVARIQSLDISVYKLSNPASCQSNQPYTKIVYGGTNIDQLSYAGGLYLDNDTYLYIVDRDQNKVLITDTDGNYITHIAGSQGSGSTELWRPHSVTKINDYIYIADTDNSRVAIWKVDSYNPFTVIPTNYIIPLTGYGNGKPRSIASYSNQIYVTTKDVLVIFKIEDDGVTYTEVASFNISNYETDTNYEFDYCNGIAVDVNNIYVVTDDKTIDSTDTHILMIDNSFETHSDLHLYQPDFDSYASDNGVNQPINISIVAGEHFVDAGISSLSLTGDSWWQLNQADLSFDFTFEGFMGEFNADLEVAFDIVADIVGANLSIPISITSGTNDIVTEVSSFSLTGELLLAYEADADITIEDFATLEASPPYVAQGSLKIPSIIIDGRVLGEGRATGSILIAPLDIKAGSGAVLNATLGYIDVTTIGIKHGYSHSRIRLAPLIATSYGFSNEYAVGNLTIPVIGVVSSGRQSPTAKLKGELTPIYIKGMAYPSTTIKGDIEISLSLEATSYLSPYVIGNLELRIPADMYMLIEPVEGLGAGKTQLVTLPLSAVSEYDISANSVVWINDELYLVLSDGLYKLNTTVQDSSTAVLTLPSIDIDISSIKRRLDMFVTTPELDGNLEVSIVTEGSGNSYTYPTDSLPRRDGEVRIRFGKGLKRTGRFRKLTITNNGKIEIDRIRLLETMRRRER